jgi:hypothetical protein
MVNVSTLFYVLENLEGKSDDVIDFEEIHEMEQKYLKGIFGLIDQAGSEISPTIVKNILQSTGTQ